MTIPAYFIITISFVTILFIIAFGISFAIPPTINRYKEGGISLNLKAYERDVDLKNDYLDNRKLVFYLQNKKDLAKILYTFVIFDIKNGHIKYLNSYTPKNIKKIGEHPDGMIYANPNACTPHYALGIDEDFYVFTYGPCNYFYYIDPINAKMKIITSKDIGLPDVVAFGDTFYRDNKYIYLSGTVATAYGWKVELFKATIKFEKIEKIYEFPNNIIYAPHATKKQNNLLLNSQFISSQFRLLDLNKTFSTRKELSNFIMHEKYESMGLLAKINIQLSRYLNYFGTRILKGSLFVAGQVKTAIFNGRLLNNLEKGLLNKYLPGKFMSTPEATYNKLDSNFVEILRSSHNFTSLPGEIIVINMESNEFASYKTSTSNSAHFEVYGDHIYTSSHNFGSLIGGFYFTGPAAIDKFKLKKGKLIHQGTFQNPKAYRFTSHKLFSYDNKTYIVTFAQPNRLLLIDANKMSLVYYEDIGRDHLSETEDVLGYLNLMGFDHKDIITSFDVANDGRTMVFLSSEFLYIYDLVERKILEQVDYLHSDELFKNFPLDAYQLKTLHTQFL